MILPRRMTFQLTPLLDLLLIVIFAQYMEIRQSAAETEFAVQTEAERRVALLEKEFARKSRELLEEFEDKQDAMHREHQRRSSDLDIRREEVETALQSVEQQQQVTGDLFAELFQVPEELVDEVVKLRNPAEPRSEEQEQKLRYQCEIAMNFWSSKLISSGYVG